MNASQNVVYRHARTAVDFLINGAMRKLENEVADNEPTAHLLAGLVANVHSECDDWCESIQDIEPNQISVGLNCSRNPHNIATAIIDLLVELNGLEGLESASMRRIEATVTMMRERNRQDSTTFSATTDFKLAAQSCPPDLQCPLCAAGVPVRHVVAGVPQRLVAVFAFHPSTGESEAIKMAHACGLQVLTYNADGKAGVVGTQAQIDTLARDLSYGPESVQPMPAV